MKNESIEPHRLGIVIPCYNEQEVLPETITQMSALLQKLVDAKKVLPNSRIYFVDDGSRDRTWELISEASTRNSYVEGFKLAGNRGHQNALVAGLENAEGDMLISIDADLQDDIGVIEDMVDHYNSGVDIVYGVRRRREKDTAFKRWTALGYYYLLEKMGVNIVFNHADYRLLSRRSIEALKQYQEVNLFLRGIIPTIGFPSAIVEYDRAERLAGESKYPIKKMLKLAVDGVTSFSHVPLRLISVTGLTVFGISMVISLWALFVRLFSDDAVPGWASSVLPMYVLGGVQLLSLGVIGEYVAKIYIETKSRPKYFLDKVTEAVQNRRD